MIQVQRTKTDILNPVTLNKNYIYVSLNREKTHAVAEHYIFITDFMEDEYGELDKDSGVYNLLFSSLNYQLMQQGDTQLTATEKTSLKKSLGKKLQDLRKEAKKYLTR